MTSGQETVRVYFGTQNAHTCLLTYLLAPGPLRNSRPVTVSLIMIRPIFKLGEAIRAGSKKKRSAGVQPCLFSFSFFLSLFLLLLPFFFSPFPLCLSLVPGLPFPRSSWRVWTVGIQPGRQTISSAFWVKNHTSHHSAFTTHCNPTIPATYGYGVSQKTIGGMVLSRPTICRYVICVTVE